MLRRLYQATVHDRRLVQEANLENPRPHLAAVVRKLLTREKLVKRTLGVVINSKRRKLAVEEWRSKSMREWFTLFSAFDLTASKEAVRRLRQLFILPSDFILSLQQNAVYDDRLILGSSIRRKTEIRQMVCSQFSGIEGARYEYVLHDIHMVRLTGQTGQNGNALYIAEKGWILEIGKDTEEAREFRGKRVDNLPVVKRLNRKLIEGMSTHNYNINLIERLMEVRNLALGVPFSKGTKSGKEVLTYLKGIARQKRSGEILQDSDETPLSKTSKEGIGQYVIFNIDSAVEIGHAPTSISY
jgi:hypothetical protein